MYGRPEISHENEDHLPCMCMSKSTLFEWPSSLPQCRCLGVSHPGDGGGGAGSDTRTGRWLKGAEEKTYRQSGAQRKVTSGYTSRPFQVAPPWLYGPCGL